MKISDERLGELIEQFPASVIMSQFIIDTGFALRELRDLRAERDTLREALKQIAIDPLGRTLTPQRIARAALAAQERKP